MLLSLIPILLISQYNHPSADDFNYGVATAHAWQNTHSITEVLNAAWEKTVEVYHHWQGSYFAVFLMCLQPAIFGEGYYALTTAVLLAAYIGATAFFLKVLLRNIFSCNKDTYRIIVSVILLLSIQYAYLPVEEFFWYNGGVYYTLFYSLTLFLFGFVLLWWTDTRLWVKRISYALSFVLTLLVSGGNYTNALTVAVLFSVAALFCIWKRRRKAVCVCILLTVSLFFLGISIVAPGNAVRQASVAPPNAISAILISFFYGLYSFCNATTLPVLIGWVAIAPLLYRVAANCPFKFPLPGAVVFFSYCVYCAQVTPPFYALGINLPGRIINIVYHSYFIFVAFDLLYFFGWLSHKDAENPLVLRVGKACREHLPRCLVVICVCFVCAILGLCRVGKANGRLSIEHLPMSAQACLSLMSGEAQQYDLEMTQRLSQYEDPLQRAVVCPPLQARPSLLFNNDISSDPADWRNISVANYYGKESVAIANEEGRTRN